MGDLVAERRLHQKCPAVRLVPIEDIISERVFPLDVGQEEERRVQQGSDQFMNKTISKEEGMKRKEGMHDFRN